MKPSLLILGLSLLFVCASNSQTGSFSVVHTFTGPDGERPGVLTQDKSGNLYGTTNYGGISGGNECVDGCGVVFKIVPESNSFSDLYEFTGQADGAAPPYGVIHAPSGALYGVADSPGMMFRLSSQGAEKTLYTFSNRDLAFGPATGLTADRDGNLYGMTLRGGPNDYGVIYKYDSSGVFSVLHYFGEGDDGYYPAWSLTYSPSGSLFGTTTAGGTLGGGVLFKLDSTGAYTVLYNFCCSGGFMPSSPLTEDPEGNLYGTTFAGGFEFGVVFKLDRAGTYSVLYNFGNGTDGGDPLGPLVRDNDTGTLYGTAESGGSNNYGVIFQVDSGGNETVLYSLTGGLGGQAPGSGLVARKLPSGLTEFFGTTPIGGTGCLTNALPGCGTVFKVTLNQ